MEIQSNKTFIYLCAAATPSASAYLSQLLLFSSDSWSLALTVTTLFESFFISQFFVLCFFWFSFFHWIVSLWINFLSSLSFTFHRQTPFCPLSHSRCISIGVRPPRWTQTQVDSSCGGGDLLSCRLPDAQSAHQPTHTHSHTQAHLASGGSVSLLALDTCLSLHNIKSSYLIWTVIMS